MHVYQRPVHFSETDAAGVTHFARLATFIEEAEHDFFHSRGVLVIGPNFGWPRIRMEIDYRSPCSFGDLLEIRLANPVFHHSTLQYDFAVVRMPAPGESADSGHERTVCEGCMTVCHVVRDPAHPTGLRSEPIAEVVKERLSRPVSST
jgi:acyl-CoA thioesterase FadM